MSSLLVPFVRLVDHEHVPVAGQLETVRWRAAWADDGVTLIDRDSGETALEFGGDEAMSLQLSRSMRLVQPGWLMRSLGHEVVEEHRLHVVLRGLLRGRVHLSAVVERTELLEGLPMLETPPHDVPLQALLDLLVTSLALGARVAHAAEIEPSESEAEPVPVVIAAGSDDVIASAARYQRREASAVEAPREETPYQVRAERDRLRDKLRELEKQNVSQHARIRELENDSLIADLETQLGAARARLDGANKEATDARNRLESRVRQHDEQLSQLTDRLKILTAQNKELDAARATLQAHIDARQTERDEARHELDQVRRELEVISTQRERFKSSHEAAAERIATLEHRLAEEASGRESAERARDDQARAIAAGEDELRRTREQFEMIEQELATLRIAYDEARETHRAELAEVQHGWTTLHEHNADSELLANVELPVTRHLCPACRQAGVRAHMFRLPSSHLVGGRDGRIQRVVSQANAEDARSYSFNDPRPAAGAVPDIAIHTAVCQRCGHTASLFEPA